MINLYTRYDPWNFQIDTQNSFIIALFGRRYIFQTIMFWYQFVNFFRVYLEKNSGYFIFELIVGNSAYNFIEDIVSFLNYITLLILNLD